MPNNKKKISDKNLETLGVIHEAVCNTFEIGLKDLFIKSRKHEVVTPRQWFQYLCCKVLDMKHMNLEVIARYYCDITGNYQTHANVLHSFKKIGDFISLGGIEQELEEDLLYEIRRDAGLKGVKVLSIPLSGSSMCNQIKFNIQKLC